MKKTFGLIALGALVLLGACSSKSTPQATTEATIPAATSAAPSNNVTVTLGATDATHMYIHLSASSATAGKVTFNVKNADTKKHEFVVLKTDTPAANFTIGSFEGETDRIDEDKAGTNVGETGDMEAGASKTLAIDLKAGHYALVCNLKGHYRMGMRTDFTVS